MSSIEHPARRPLAGRFGFIVLGGLAGAALGVFLMAFHVADEPVEFRSTAKLKVTEPVRAGNDPMTSREGFYADIAAQLVSPEMMELGWERLLRLHPDMPFCRMDVDAFPHLENSTILVVATGEKAGCARAYLDALIEQYLVVRQDGAMLAGGETVFIPGLGAPTEHTGNVEIQEHAGAAVEMALNHTYLLLRAGYAGSMAGGLAGFLLSLWFAGRAPGGRDKVELGRTVEDPLVSSESALPGGVVQRRNTATAGLLAAAAAGIVAGILFQTVCVASRPPVFRSLAKVIDADAEGPVAQTDQHRRTLAVLESDHLRDKVQARMRALYPKSKNIHVQISAHQPPGSAIFVIIAEGTEPVYTRRFLAALLEQFVLNREGLGHVVIHERPTQAAEAVEDWQVPLTAGGVVGGLLGAGAGCFGLYRRRRS